MSKQQEQGSQQIQVMTGDDMSRGRYSNNVFVSHTAEEFYLDWMLNAPNGIHMVARIMVSPAHIKRVLSALQGNIEKYESKFGEIRVIATPKEQMFQ